MSIFKKTFLAGVGAISLSKERAKRIAKELVDQGKLRQKEGRKLVDDMMKRADATRKEVEKTINHQVDSAYRRINLGTQEQLKRMEKRIQDLEGKLAKKTGKQYATVKPKRRASAARPKKRKR